METTDFGFDASFFNNKLSLLATCYQRDTKNFLNLLPITSIDGFDVTGINAGNVVNQGIEVELGYNTYIGNDYRFSISGNLTTVSNRLTAITVDHLQLRNVVWASNTRVFQIGKLIQMTVLTCAKPFLTFSTA